MTFEQAWNEYRFSGGIIKADAKHFYEAGTRGTENPTGAQESGAAFTKAELTDIFMSNATISDRECDKVIKALVAVGAINRVSSSKQGNGELELPHSSVKGDV